MCKTVLRIGPCKDRSAGRRSRRAGGYAGTAHTETTRQPVSDYCPRTSTCSHSIPPRARSCTQSSLSAARMTLWVEYYRIFEQPVPNAATSSLLDLTRRLSAIGCSLSALRRPLTSLWPVARWPPPPHSPLTLLSDSFALPPVPACPFGAQRKARAARRIAQGELPRRRADSGSDTDHSSSGLLSDNFVSVSRRISQATSAAPVELREMGGFCIVCLSIKEHVKHQAVEVGGRCTSCTRSYRLPTVATRDEPTSLATFRSRWTTNVRPYSAADRARSGLAGAGGGLQPDCPASPTSRSARSLSHPLPSSAAISRSA